MVSKKYKLIMLYPPKTGSISLKNCFVDSKIYFDAFDPKYHQPNTHLYLSELLDCFKIDNHEEYKIGQIFRDPYKRFVSAYYHFIPHLPQHFKTRSLKLNDFVLKYEECLNSEDYIKCMYDDPEWVYRLINNKINFGFTRYFVPQLKWNDINANVRYFKFDDIVKDTNTLSQYTGLELQQFKHHNKNGNKLENIETLNDRSLEIISRLYKDDIEHFQKII